MSHNNQAIWFLSKSLEKLANADVFICIDDVWNWNGCLIESETATKYGIKRYVVASTIVIDNYKELIEKNYPVVCEASTALL